MLDNKEAVAEVCCVARVVIEVTRVTELVECVAPAFEVVDTVLGEPVVFGCTETQAPL